jgi:hypothetical protein
MAGTNGSFILLVFLPNPKPVVLWLEFSNKPELGLITNSETSTTLVSI